MALITESIKDRLREAFGADSQETIGKKLNMTQGNVSKLLSGTQQPTIDTLYRIATTYDVSIDWLMGLSDRKKCIKPDSNVTYGLAVEVLQNLIQSGSKLVDDEKQNQMEIKIEDPIIVKLLRKCRTLSKADWDLFKEWKNTKLSLFDDKPVRWTHTFKNNNVEFLAGEATSESNLLEVYEEAKREEDEYAAMMGDSPSPFKD